MGNAECGVRNAEWGVGNGEWGRRNWKSGEFGWAVGNRRHGLGRRWARRREGPWRREGWNRRRLAEAPLRGPGEATEGRLVRSLF